MDSATIKETFKKLGYNVSKTSRMLDIDYDKMKQMLGVGEIPPARKPTVEKPLDIRQLGTIGLRRWVVAVKPCNVPEWPPEYRNAILTARYRYDDGTHEMFTEVRDGWNILYSQRRRNPVAERNYFSTRKEEDDAS